MAVKRGPAGLPRLGLGATAAAIAGAAGLATDRLSLDRRARQRLSSAATYEHIPDEILAVVAEDGVPLHVEIDAPRATPERIEGAGAAPTVVFAHGFCLNLRSWVLQRRALTEAGFRVVLWDQRGHGESERGSEESCDIDQLGRDMKAVIDATCPEGPLVLVGHSMGGMTIMALADHAPELVEERVLATAFVATSAGGAQLISLGFGERFGEILGRIGPGLLDGLGARSKVLHRLRPLGREVEDFFVEQLSFASPVSPAAIRFTGDMIFATPFEVMSDFLPTFDAHDKLHALGNFHGQEVLVFNGVQDILTPPDHSAAIVRHVPGAEHLLVRDAGHIIMIEHPDVLNEQLLDLIERGRRAVAEDVAVEAKPRVRRTVTDVTKRRELEAARASTRASDATNRQKRAQQARDAADRKTKPAQAKAKAAQAKAKAATRKRAVPADGKIPAGVMPTGAGKVAAPKASVAGKAAAGKGGRADGGAATRAKTAKKAAGDEAARKSAS